MSAAIGGSFFTSSVVIAINFATGVVAARLLGPEGRGVLALVVFAPQVIVAFARLPLMQYMILSWRLSEQGDWIGFGALKSASLKFSIVLLPFCIAGTGLFAQSRAQDYVLEAMIFSGIFLFASQQNQFFEGAILCFSKYRIANFVRVGVPLAYLALIPIFAWNSISISSFVFAQAVSIILLLSVREYLYSKLPIAETSQVGIRLKVTDLMCRVSNLYWSSVSSFVSQNIDKITVVALMPAETVGLYFVAASVAYPFSTVINTVVQGMGLARLTDGGDSLVVSRSHKLLNLVTTAVVFTTPPAVFVVNSLVVLIFGDRFSDAAQLAAILVPCFLLLSIRTALQTVTTALVGPEAVSGSNMLFMGMFVVCFGVSSLLGFSIGIAFSLTAASLSSGAFMLRKIHEDNVQLDLVEAFFPNISSLIYLLEEVTRVVIFPWTSWRRRSRKNGH